MNKAIRFIKVPQDRKNEIFLKDEVKKVNEIYIGQESGIIYFIEGENETKRKMDLKNEIENENPFLNFDFENWIKKITL